MDRKATDTPRRRLQRLLGECAPAACFVDAARNARGTGRYVRREIIAAVAARIADHWGADSSSVHVFVAGVCARGRLSAHVLSAALCHAERLRKRLPAARPRVPDVPQRVFLGALVLVCAHAFGWRSHEAAKRAAGWTHGRYASIDAALMAAELAAVLRGAKPLSAADVECASRRLFEDAGGSPLVPRSVPVALLLSDVPNP